MRNEGCGGFNPPGQVPVGGKNETAVSFVKNLKLVFRRRYVVSFCCSRTSINSVPLCQGILYFTSCLLPATAPLRGTS